MPRLTVRITHIFALVLLLVILSLAAQTPAQADPDYSNVNDILGGRRTLFRNDDLLLTKYPAAVDVDVTILQTLNDEISNQINYGVSGPSSFVTAAPRMFDLSRDVQVTLYTGGAMLHDEASGFDTVFPNNLGAETMYQSVNAIGDFTGDSYQDLAFIAGQNIYVLTANNVSDMGNGFFYSTPIPLPINNTYQLALAADDFDADGVTELALAASNLDGTVQIIIYKPQATFDPNGQIESLQFNNIGTTATSAAESIFSVALTSGAFTGAQNTSNQVPYRQLVLLYQRLDQDSLESTNLAGITVTASDTPPQDTVTLLYDNPWQDGVPEIGGLASDYLDFFSTTEQVVILSQDGLAEAELTVMTSDANLNQSPASTLGLPGQFINGLGLGNFDQPNGESSPLVLEIAVAGYSIEAPSCKPILQYGQIISFYHLDVTNNYAISPAAVAQVGDTCYDLFNNDPTPTVQLTIGDTQGRSLFLGAPTVMSTQHTQPHLVLGVPPMHVDFATPDGVSAPEVVNASAVPGSFFSQYSTVMSGTKQSSRVGTNSLTNAASVAISGGYRWGGAVSGSVTVKAGASAGYMNEKSTSTLYQEYSSEGFDASTNTGVDDQVWISMESHYVYAFPVIGQYVCPDAQPTCPDNELVPQLVLFSGTSISEVESVPGYSVESYHPVREANNIFSYPWNMTQLKLAEGDIDLLTPENPTAFSIDDGSSIAGVNWSNGSVSGETSGTATNINWASYLSISTQPGIEGGASGSLKLSYNGSKAISTLNTLVTRVGQSTGINIYKPSTFQDASYHAYSIFPYIYGDVPPVGTVQTGTLTSTVQTTGIMRSGFTVSPLDPTAGEWWKDAYTLPDPAVAHPLRWYFTKNPFTTLPPNCLNITGYTAQCAFLSGSTGKIYNNDLLKMKGLIITPAGANGEGPQVTSATAGDQLNIQARVYNNSLADMPAGSQIVVQFYTQPFDPHTNEPAGNAFLINNVSVAGLPGFDSSNSGGVNPNWTLVGTPFDTTPYSGQSLVFWVVTVLKDNQGNPLAEMPEHGLTGVPPTLASVEDALQWTQEYSNNVGLFPYLFDIIPQSEEQAIAEAANAPDRLRVEALELSKPTAMLYEQVVLGADIHANRSRKDVETLFYVGNPATRGTAFDYERISHIPGGNYRHVEVNYRPQRCGKHNLYVKVVPNGATAHTQLTVTINPRATVREMRKLVASVFPPGELLQQEKRGDGMIGRLKTAQKAFKNNDNATAFQALATFEGRVQGQRGKSLPEGLADTLLEQLGLIRSCVK